MRKVLIIGECFSKNIGDQAVAYVTQWLVEQTSTDDTVFTYLDLSGRTEEQKTNYWISDKRAKWRTLRVALSRIGLIDYLLKKKSAYSLIPKYKSIISGNNFDCAIFCGGQLINDMFVCQMEAVAKLLMENEIPVIYNGVGLGYVNHIGKKIFRRILSYPNVKGITCRCNSDRFNTTLGLTKQLALSTYDIAVFSPDAYGVKVKGNGSKVGLGIMRSTRFPYEQIKSFWKKIVSELDKRGVGWKFFYTGSSCDYELALDIIQELQLPNDNSYYINENISNPMNCMVELSSFERIISFRLHSHILSYALGIPSVAILWDEKINDFFEKIGRTSAVFSVETDVRQIVDSMFGLPRYDESKILKSKSDSKKLLCCLLKDIYE